MENKRTAGLTAMDGFTLAEILITLAIIGVVAAMTIPTIAQGMQEQATISAVKKAYSTLSTAFDMTKKENGTPDIWDLATTPSNIMDKMVPYLNIMKNCGTGTGCFPTGVTYRNLGTGDWVNFDTYPSFYKVRLQDGTGIAAIVASTDCSGDVGDTVLLHNSVCGAYEVDVNGFKSPNQGGRDVFAFLLTKFGIVPIGTAADNSDYNFPNNCIPGETGEGCTAWVIYNENMGYLHCTGLNWATKRSCN